MKHRLNIYNRHSELKAHHHDKVFVVVPCFNEATSLATVITQLRGTCDHILVVDDGSQDESAAIAQRMGVTVIRHPINLGAGAAIQTGIDFAHKNGAGVVVTFDADGQHSAEDIGKMIELMNRECADVVFGSRFMGNTYSLGFQRKWVLKGAAFMTWLFTGLRFSDAHNGLRVMNRHAASVINMRQNRMAHASEIVGLIKRHRLRYVEAPMTLTYTAYSIEKGQRTWSGAFAIVADLAWGLLHR